MLKVKAQRKTIQCGPNVYLGSPSWKTKTQLFPK